MRLALRAFSVWLCALALAASGVLAQDWPQWRGANRDAKAASFTAPKTWPKELTQKWKVSVGEGVATPSLAGDKLYLRTKSRLYAFGPQVPR